jgi:hypothetical protein
VRDLHAEVYSVRADTKPVWPSTGPMAGEDKSAIFASLVEAPLAQVEDIVMSDRPYSEVLTADHTMTDARLAVMLGLAYDSAGPEWQPARHTDGRPEAGVLSSTGVLQRWYTNLSGKHRNRANFVTRAFLCNEIGAFDMPVLPDFDPTDDLGTADKLATDPACANCHRTLEPLAAYFWGFDVNITPDRIREDCDQGGAQCYPVPYWDAAAADGWVELGLPPPGFGGEPGTDLSDLARQLVADPRFETCAVEQAWAFLAQEPEPDEMPSRLLQTATATLHDSGLNWREMVRQIVLSNAFLAADAPPLQVRPEAFARSLEALTGYAWVVDDPSWGRIEVLESSMVGVRDLAGGTDQDRIQSPWLGPSPTALLAWEAAARLAAEHAIYVSGGAEGRLLDATLTDERAVRQQMVLLFAATTSERVRPRGPEVDALYALFGAVRDVELSRELARGGDDEAAVRGAWAAVLRALIVDPRAVTY